MDGNLAPLYQRCLNRINLSGEYAFMEKQRTILVVEDDPSITELLSIHFSANAFTVDCVADGALGLEKALQGAYSLVILDITLPRLSGIDICKELRAKRPTMPIIMLTSRGAEMDRIIGLEVGADDYVVKPFSVYELMARVRARLRIANAAPEAAPSTDDGQVLTLGSLTVLLSKRAVLIDGQAVDITRKEFDVLVHLFEHRGEVVSRNQLLEQVWGSSVSRYLDTISTLVGRLRRKLERAAPGSYFIRTVRGVGYRLSEVDELHKAPQDEQDD